METLNTKTRTTVNELTDDCRWAVKYITYKNKNNRPLATEILD